MRAIFLIIIFSIFAFGEDCDHILRFSSTKRTDSFTVSSNLLRYRSCDGLSDWISIKFSENHLSIYFEAKKAPSFEDRNSVIYSVHYDGSNTFGQVVAEPRTYRFLCQWDDEGALIEDKDYSASLLFDEEGFLSPGADKDKWIFKPKRQGYCLEVSATNDFILEARQGPKGFGVPVEIIGETFSKRLYITNAIMNQQIDFTISRPENSGAGDIKYAFSLKPARPLVLVHGIRSNPTWHNDNLTSFGDLKSKACKYGDFPPCMVFDFPWDSEKGSIEDYCGEKSSEFNLFGFTHKRCGDWKLKPVFFAHSMGGLLLAEQWKKKAFREATGGAVFAGSPFCGSDIANVVLQTELRRKVKKTADLFDKTKTSTDNLRFLARGSKSIPERLKKIDAGFPVLFLVGEFTEDLVTGRGDKRVNVSSASLFNTLSLSHEDHLVLTMEHGELVDIALPPGGKYDGICSKLKEILEH